MDKNLIEIIIPEQYRAIQSADIIINGITIVSGINGCGKSTLSKLLYNTYKYSINYNHLVIYLINDKLQPYYGILNQLQTSMMFRFRQSGRIHRWRQLSSIENIDDYFDELKIFCRNFIEREHDLNREGETMLTERIWRIIWTALNNEGDENLESNINAMITQMEDVIRSLMMLIQERPTNILTDRISMKMQGDIPSNISISEYGDAFIGPEAHSVALPHYIQKVVYIDTPMILGIESFNGPDHWDDLNNEVRSLTADNYGGHINETIQREILHGEAVYDSEAIEGTLTFKREDGKIFDLIDCATGVKAFSIIQLLLKNNALKKDTLLIIDEPEAHLHPQWIVEYARLILMLHKELGVKFFIASHSTDMVGALKEMSPTLEVSDLNFYVAEEADDMRYTYNHLGNDVEPIFASFNKSFEKLDYYTGNNDEE